MMATTPSRYLPMPPDGETTLYRFYDASGVLLYVGITCKPYLRFATHRKRTDWWELADSCQLERFPTRAAALGAETDAIALAQRSLYASRPTFSRPWTPRPSGRGLAEPSGSDVRR
jgi:hypothetical protein